MSTSSLIWLSYGAMSVGGLIVLGVARVRWHSRASRSSIAVPAWPDFEIVDRGELIHFVPLDDSGHVLAKACPCQPRRTANRRRSGRRVVYVDHQVVARLTAARHAGHRLWLSASRVARWTGPPRGVW